MRLFSSLLLLVVGCGPDKGPPAATTPSDGDTDTDTDTDSDTDTDADLDSGATDSGSTGPTDTATDTGLTDPGLVTGEWIGECTDPLSTYLNYYELDMRLVETAGVVTGKGRMTISEVVVVGSTGGTSTSTYTTTFGAPLLFDGTFDGVSAIEVALALDYGTYASPLDAAIDGTIVGTTWTGTLASTLYTDYPVLGCVFDRQ